MSGIQFSTSEGSIGHQKEIIAMQGATAIVAAAIAAKSIVPGSEAICALIKDTKEALIGEKSD